MKRNLSVITVPFPPRMMSTSRNPTAMPVEYARDVLNMFTLTSGAGSKRNGVQKVGNAIGGDETILRLMHFVPASGALQLLAVTDAGSIYLYDDGDWTSVYTGLSTSGHVRWTHFGNHLALCNGIDTPLKWDGTSFSKISQWIQDDGIDLTYVDGDTLTFTGDETLYPAGTEVKLRLGSGTYVETTVLSVSASSGTVTLNLSDAVATAALDELHYKAYPPAFAFIMAAHNRLWGLGTGALQANGFSANADRNRVYYTDGLNDPDAWRNDDGFLQHINLNDKTPTSDELIAMAIKDGLTVFFFRNFAQVWAGTDPTATGDFTWQKTISVGTVHGDLVVNLPNDIGFFTRYGARTISRALQTEQLDVSDLGSDVDPTIAGAIQEITATDNAYRDAHTFYEDRQGWFGFKLGNVVVVYQVASAASGWARFDGLFADATAFMNTPDGKLYLASGGQLYVYDHDTYDDDGEAIQTRWWTPWLNFSSDFKRWANKYVELVTEQGAPVNITLRRYKSYNSSSSVSQELTATTAADYWDDGDWDDALWDNGYPKPAVVRDGYVADVLAYAVESSTTTGPMTIFGFKLYGKQER
ncbi:MAG: hypothetical protein GC134_01890 [Proteobacteria bacterium]|nr:hypothetical protein [Pseudomonadota bacterium]